MTSPTRRFLVPLAVALMAISVLTGAAHAALILDQAFDPGPAPTIGSGVSLAIPIKVAARHLAGIVSEWIVTARRTLG